MTSFLNYITIFVVYMYIVVSFVRAQQESYTGRDIYRDDPTKSIGSNSKSKVVKGNVNTVGVMQQNEQEQHRQLVQDPVQVLNARCAVDNFILGFGYSQNLEESGVSFRRADANGAAGRNRLVAVVNYMIEVRMKNGTLTFRDSLVDFYNQSSLVLNFTNTLVSMPKVIYDEHEGRFVVVAILDGTTVMTQSRMLLAVSKNELPDTINAWNFFSFSSSLTIGGSLSAAGYPGFEVDEEAVYITASIFDTVTRGFTGSRLWIVEKGVVGGFYGGDALPIIRGPFDPYQGIDIPSLGGTTLPAQIHGSGGVGGSIGSFLVSLTLLFDTFSLQVLTVNNPLSTPTISYNSVLLGSLGQSVLPPSAPQLGTTTLINAFDLRITDAVWRNNKLWVTLTITPLAGDPDANQATVHWIRVDTTGGVFTLEAEGNLGGESFSTGAHTYYPSVAVNKRGETAFGYGASSRTMYAGAFGSLLLGTREFPFVVKQGLDSYVRRNSRNISSWGQFSGISVDPVDDSFWIYNQFADIKGLAAEDGDGRWGTAWARVYCNEIASPTKAPTNSPTKASTKSPTTKAPTKLPTKAPSKSPVQAVTPTKISNTIAPTQAPTDSENSYGLFGLRLFCPFTLCGLFGRFLGLCS